MKRLLINGKLKNHYFLDRLIIKIKFLDKVWYEIKWDVLKINFIFNCKFWNDKLKKKIIIFGSEVLI